MNITTMAADTGSLIHETSAICKHNILIQKTIIHSGLNVEIYYITSFQNIYGLSVIPIKILGQEYVYMEVNLHTFCKSI
jgi:hypothetical protein